MTWIKSLIGWYKLNIDGLTKTKLLTAKGVIRTDEGEWILRFAKFIGLKTIEMIEAWSLQISLEITILINIKKIEIEVVCFPYKHS